MRELGIDVERGLQRAYRGGVIAGERMQTAECAVGKIVAIIDQDRRRYIGDTLT